MTINDIFRDARGRLPVASAGQPTCQLPSSFQGNPCQAVPDHHAPCRAYWHNGFEEWYQLPPARHGNL